jgi:hypothetical protein
VLRRLTRTEYLATVRDVLGEGLEGAVDLPADDTLGGFDRSDAVLGMPPALVEKYAGAAEALARAAWAADFTPALHARLEAEAVPHTTGVPSGGAFWRLNGNGSLSATVTFTSSGPFTLAARAAGTALHGVAPRLLFRLDGRLVRTFEVHAPPSAPAVYAHVAQVDAGRHVLAVELDNYAYDGGASPPERALLVDWFEARREERAVPLAQARLRTCEPAAEGEGPCARRILERLASRAWRRQATAGEVDRLAALAAQARAEGEDFGASVQRAAQAVLLSPHFLFHVEPGAGDAGGGGGGSGPASPLPPEALAARLSYFLWSSVPDAPLREAAASGRLAEPGELEAQARRMLADPRAEALVQGFAGQWLQFRGLAAHAPDPARFPGVDGGLVADMEAQAAAVFRELLHADRPAQDLLDADFTYLNDRLAAHLGLPPPGSAALTRVAVADGRRRGWLAQPAFLLATSHPDETSPVKRGKWVLGQLLCREPPPPPPDVPSLPPPSGGAPLSKRQLLEHHRAEPACSGCHRVMDPVGFGLENFDPTGRWREADERGAPVDATGVLPGGRAFSGPAELTALLKEDPDLPGCVAHHLLVYALARSLRPEDRCHLERVVQSFAGRGHRLSELVVLVATSPAFTHR